MSNQTALPPEFDPVYYRENNADLASMTDALRAEHYKLHGQKEGRAASKAAMREYFLEFLKSQDSVLEIGPFCNPCISGPNVQYFDVLDREGLLERANLVKYPYQNAPYIEFVSPIGDLGIVDRQFSAVVSSHCIEHQPDIVQHLDDVSRILQKGGHYFLLIPDKRYCFDHFIAESTIANIINAHHEKRAVHNLASVIEHRALTTHNDTARHWRGDHADPGYTESIAHKTRAAISEHAKAEGGYVDVHAWQFTPSSFRHVIGTLNILGEIDLAVERVYATPHGRNEFTAVLRKNTEG